MYSPFLIVPGPHGWALSWRVTSLPVDNPGVRLVGAADVVLGQQARHPCAQRGAVHPALAGRGLLHRRHEDKVARQQLELIVILGRVRVHDLQRLQQADGRQTLEALTDASELSVRSPIYLVVSEADVPREEHSEPVTRQRHLDVLGQLLQSWKVTGLEVVRQSDMKLLFMGLDVSIWTKGNRTVIVL